MSKYKAGDKVVSDVYETNANGLVKIGNAAYRVAIHEDMLEIMAKPLPEYTEKLEKKNENKQKRIEKLVERLHRQAAQITRLLADNAELKKGREAIRDNAFEAGLIRGQEEAWELMIKIGNMYCYDLEKIFGSSEPCDIITNLSYQKVAAKVAEWERQNEICVGDVLLSIGTCDKCVVTYICNETITILWDDGSSGKRSENSIREEYKKIGHIDVDAWMAQIGDER